MEAISTQETILLPRLLMVVYSVIAVITSFLLYFCSVCLYQIHKLFTLWNDKVMTMTAVCIMVSLIFVIVNCGLRIASFVIRFNTQSGDDHIEDVVILTQSFTAMWLFMVFVFDVYKWTFFVVSTDPSIDPYQQTEILKNRHQRLKTVLILSQSLILIMNLALLFGGLFTLD